jgi:hypothetical protein
MMFNGNVVFLLIIIAVGLRATIDPELSTWDVVKALGIVLGFAIFATLEPGLRIVGHGISDLLLARQPGILRWLSTFPKSEKESRRRLRKYLCKVQTTYPTKEHRSMPRRSIRHLISSLLILAVAALAAFGAVRPAAAATYVISVDPGYIYLNVAPGATAEATFKVTTAAEESVFPVINAGWLTLDADDWYGSRTVKVTADARGMAPGDVRVARIQLSSYPTDVSVPVVLAVNGPSAPPPIALSQARVDFGTLTPGQSAVSYVSLALPEAADLSITADADWIEARVSRTEGVNTALISVYPIKQRMTAFQAYIGTIEVRAGSLPPVQIPVTARMASPEAQAAETTAPASTEAPFTDVPADHWAAAATAELAAKGVINGVGNGKFDPDGTVTREQLAKLLVMAFGLSHYPDPSPYPDVTSDRWSAEYIVAAGPFMARYKDGLFHPEYPAIREEIAVALSKLKGMKPAANPDNWRWFTDYKQINPSAEGWVATARENGLIGGFPDRTFRPRDPVTRAQMAVLLQRASLICGVSPEPGCAAPMGKADQTLAGATLGGPRSLADKTLGTATEERSGYVNSYFAIYDDGNVTVQYVTPSDTVWSVRLVGEGATPRGIKIGDTLEAVRRAYGPQGELKDGVLSYRTGAEFDFFYIQFFIVEGNVDSILLTQSK